jgi:hypothetical protein
MNINIDHNTILADHTLKAFVQALLTASDYDRSVKIEIVRGVECEDSVKVHLMTIDEEEAEEAKT